MRLKEPYAPLAPLHIYIVNQGPVSPDPGLCPRDAQDLYALRRPVTSRQSHMLIYLAKFYGLVFLNPHFIGNDLSDDGLLTCPSRLVELLEVHYCLDETKFLEHQEDIRRQERSVPTPQMGSSSSNNKSSSSSSRPVSMAPPPLPQSPQPAQQAYQSIMPPPLSPTQQQQQEQHRRQQQQHAAQFAMSMPPPPPPPQPLPSHYPSTIPPSGYSSSMPPPPPVVSASHASVSAPIPKMSPSQKRRREEGGREAYERAVRRKSSPTRPEPVFEFLTFAQANALYPDRPVTPDTPPPSLKALGKRPEHKNLHGARPGPSQPAAFGPAVSPVAWPAPPMAGSPPSAWPTQQPNNYNSSPYHRKP